MEASYGGPLDPVLVVTRPRRVKKALKIDVDRLGIVALNAMARLLEMLPMHPNSPDAAKAKPDAIHFFCAHQSGAVDPATVSPTFPAREPNDRRIRKHDRLRAGEALVRAFVRHIAANGILHSLTMSYAPLRLFDWQGIGHGFYSSGCPLRYVSLPGCRLGDAGLAALAPALLKHTLTLRELRLDGCGLTSASCEWLIRLLQASNQRQKEGRRQTELSKWAGTLRIGREKRKNGLPTRAERSGAFVNEYAEPDDADRYQAPVGLVTLSVSGNSLGEDGALALANHLMQDTWLEELDVRRNGIGHKGLKALREASALRDDSEEERLLSVPALLCRLDGNIEEMEQIERLVAQQKQRAAQSKAMQRQSQSARVAQEKAGASSISPFEAEAQRARKALRYKQEAAAAAAAALERVTRGAVAASVDISDTPSGRAAQPAEAQLSAEDWDGLIKVSGGPTALLDAMEGLLSGALQRVF